MSENRVQRGIFRPKRVKITGGWRKLQSKELHDLYSLPNIVRLVRHVEDMRKGQEYTKAFLRKSEGKRLDERPWPRLEYIYPYIKWMLQQQNRTPLAQNRQL